MIIIVMCSLFLGKNKQNDVYKSLYCNHFQIFYMT